jgi:hypothetical protein
VGTEAAGILGLSANGRLGVSKTFHLSSNLGEPALSTLTYWTRLPIIGHMLAFHSDSKIKKKYVSRVRAHYKADEIIQGKYWENGKGCAVGCTIEKDDVKRSGASWHQRYEDALGVPRILASLEDRIFEGLSNGNAKEFPLRFLEAITPGADLSLVIYKFFYWMLVDPKDGVIQYATPDGKKAIQAVADVCQRKANGENIDLDTWLGLRRDAAYAAAAADAAYAYAAYAAADAAYAYAAYAAADAAAAAAYAAADAADAAYAAADAAYAADAADAAAAAASAAAASAAAASAAAASAAAAKNARNAHYKKMADKLIELLTEEKPDVRL